MNSIDNVRRKAGETIFAKGLKLMQQDQFRGFESKTTGSSCQVYTLVLGTMPYSVSLVFRNRRLQSHSCTCPAAEYQDICKHAVAAWLEFIDQQSSDESGRETFESSKTPPSVHKPTKREGELAQIRQWLEQAPQELLVERLYGIAVDMPEQRIEMAAQASLALSPPKASALNKHITSALPKRKGLWEYYKVAKYFDNAITRLQPVIEHLSNIPAEEALTWCFKAMERLESVLEHIDDSGGFRMPLELMLSSAMIQYYHRLEWSLDKRMTWLLDGQLKNDLLPDIAEFSLSDEETTAFYTLARGEFDAIDVPRNHRKRQENPRLSDLYSLLLRPPAPRLTDEQELAMQAKVACTAEDYCHLAKRWLKVGDELEAEDCLIRAQSYPRAVHTDIGIQNIREQIDLLSGKAMQVWQERWEAFKKKPEFQSWHELQSLTKQYALEQSVPADWLKQTEQILRQSAESQSDRTATWARLDNDVFRFYWATQQTEQSLLWAEQRCVNETLLMSALSTTGLYGTFPELASSLTYQAIHQHIGAGTNKAYEQSLTWLKTTRTQWGKAGAVDFRHMVQTLAAEHQRKRNFITGLHRQFAALLM